MLFFALPIAPGTAELAGDVPRVACGMTQRHRSGAESVRCHQALESVNHQPSQPCCLSRPWVRLRMPTIPEACCVLSLPACHHSRLKLLLCTPQMSILFVSSASIRRRWPCSRRLRHRNELNTRVFARRRAPHVVGCSIHGYTLPFTRPQHGWAHTRVESLSHSAQTV